MIPVAAVTRIAVITLMLGWNTIPTDIITLTLLDRHHGYINLAVCVRFKTGRQLCIHALLAAK